LRSRLHNFTWICEIMWFWGTKKINCLLLTKSAIVVNFERRD
jgi:hypothetical protein